MLEPLTVNGIFSMGGTLTLSGDNRVTWTSNGSYDSSLCLFLGTAAMASRTQNGND